MLKLENLFAGNCIFIPEGSVGYSTKGRHKFSERTKGQVIGKDMEKELIEINTSYLKKVVFNKKNYQNMVKY